MIITPARMAERLARGLPNKGAPAPEEPAEDAPDLLFMTPLRGTIDRSAAARVMILTPIISFTSEDR